MAFECVRTACHVGLRQWDWKMHRYPLKRAERAAYDNLQTKKMATGTNECDTRKVMEMRDD